MCNGIASRLKKDIGASIAAVVQLLGGRRAKTVLTKQPLLRVLPEFVEYMSTMDEYALRFAIETRDKRKCLVEELQAGK